MTAVRLALCAGVLFVTAGSHSRALAQGDAPPKIDLNMASVQALRTLPGIDADAAAHIVAHRPYESFEQFRMKSGLSAQEVDRLAPWAIVRPGPKLPAGATPISPEIFSKGAASAPAPATPGRPLKGTAVPVPPGTVQTIPVPQGTTQREVPVPKTAAPVRRARDLRAAFIYGVSAVVLAAAIVVYMRRSRPARR